MTTLVSEDRARYIVAAYLRSGPGGMMIWACCLVSLGPLSFLYHGEVLAGLALLAAPAFFVLMGAWIAHIRVRVAAVERHELRLDDVGGVLRVEPGGHLARWRWANLEQVGRHRAPMRVDGIKLGGLPTDVLMLHVRGRRHPIRLAPAWRDGERPLRASDVEAYLVDHWSRAVGEEPGWTRADVDD